MKGTENTYRHLITESKRTWREAKESRNQPEAEHCRDFVERKRKVHFGDQETEHYKQRETNTEESAAELISLHEVNGCWQVGAR